MKQYISIMMMMMLALCMTLMTAHAASDTDQNRLKVYPNPVSRGAVFTVDMPATEQSEVSVILYNTVGKVIQTLKTTDAKVELNAPEISGIYLLRIVEKQKVIAVEKIIVRE